MSDRQSSDPKKDILAFYDLCITRIARAIKTRRPGSPLAVAVTKLGDRLHDRTAAILRTRVEEALTAARAQAGEPLTISRATANAIVATVVARTVYDLIDEAAKMPSIG